MSMQDDVIELKEGQARHEEQIKSIKEDVKELQDMKQIVTDLTYSTSNLKEAVDSMRETTKMMLDKQKEADIIKEHSLHHNLWKKFKEAPLSQYIAWAIAIFMFAMFLYDKLKP